MAPTPSGGTPRASTRKKSRDSMTTAMARATTRTPKPDRAPRCGDWRPAARLGRRAGTARELPVMREGGHVEVDAAGRGIGRARLLQALDLADDLVDVVARARVYVHGSSRIARMSSRYARSYRRAPAAARRGGHWRSLQSRSPLVFSVWMARQGTTAPLTFVLRVTT